MHTDDIVTTERINTDFEMDSPYGMNEYEFRVREPLYYNLKYLLAGILFGIILVKAEVISWFRIQEMFRLQSFHMYGVIGSAVVVGILSVLLIKKFNIKTISGEKIIFTKKAFHKGQIYGGLIFGFGWAITGACPGPLFAQIGTGATVIIITLLSAIGGTWVYGKLYDQLPSLSFFRILLQSSAMEEPQEKKEIVNSLSEYELAIERTRLANDRTILSFIRTSLYFGVAGLTIDSLLNLSFGRLIDIFFWIVAFVNLTLGVISYLRLKRKLKAVKKDPGNWQVLFHEEE